MTGVRAFRLVVGAVVRVATFGELNPCARAISRVQRRFHVRKVTDRTSSGSTQDE